MRRSIPGLASALVAGAIMFGSMIAPALAAAPLWNTTGNWVINFELGGGTYPHDLMLAQDSAGDLAGSGGYPAGGAHVYAWAIDSGTVSGNTISFTAHYTASADAVTPLTIMHVTGTIAADGSMSGVWDDNYQGGSRTGTWSSASGHATPILVIVVPTTKDQCKNDGWKSVTRADSGTFKNQGDCIQFVNTGK